MENLAIAGVPCIPRDNYFLGIILTRAAAANDVHRRQLGSVQLCNIPDMEHFGESDFRHFNGKGFDFTGPYGSDAVADSRQWKTSDPIEEAPHRHHQAILIACWGASAGSVPLALPMAKPFSCSITRRTGIPILTASSISRCIP